MATNNSNKPSSFIRHDNTIRAAAVKKKIGKADRVGVNEINEMNGINKTDETDGTDKVNETGIDPEIQMVQYEQDKLMEAEKVPETTFILEFSIDAIRREYFSAIEHKKELGDRKVEIENQNMPGIKKKLRQNDWINCVEELKLLNPGYRVLMDAYVDALEKFVIAENRMVLAGGKMLGLRTGAGTLAGAADGVDMDVIYQERIRAITEAMKV